MHLKSPVLKVEITLGMYSPKNNEQHFLSNACFSSYWMFLLMLRAQDPKNKVSVCSAHTNLLQPTDILPTLFLF